MEDAMTTANIITLTRIALVPVFMILLYADFPMSATLALIVFAVASLTDGIDGYIARKYNQITNMGKFMDPLADKLLVTAAFLVFVEIGAMPAWAAMLIISREFIVTSMRIVAAGEGVIIAASNWGKLKTFIQIVGIIIIIYGFDPTAGGIINISFIPEYILPNVLSTNAFIVYLMTAVTLISGVDYIISNRKVLDFSKR